MFERRNHGKEKSPVESSDISGIGDSERLVPLQITAYTICNVKMVTHIQSINNKLAIFIFLLISSKHFIRLLFKNFAKICIFTM